MYIKKIKLGKGRIYLGQTLGRDFRYKNIYDEIDALEPLNISSVVVLQELHEMHKDALDLYELVGWKIIRYPIQDFDIPKDMNSFDKLITSVCKETLSGKNVLIHCAAGIGRTGLVATSILIKLKIQAQKALSLIRSIIPLAVETGLQGRFLLMYEDYCKKGRTNETT